VATTGTASSGSAAPPVDDARVTATIESKYFGDELIKGRRVDVETHQGVVTLGGEVASESERAQALRLARMTDGVQRIEDSLTVNASLGSANAPAPSASAPADRRAGIGQQIEDAAAVTKIQSKFFLDSQVRAGDISVTSKNGVVTLDGTAPSAAAKQRAITIARETDGVAQVIDRITVRKPTAKR
jgi:hyperosmotically inducible protein